MKIFSKVDPDTFYVVTGSKVRICRNGDKLTIPNLQIPEQAKRFNPEIQAELMAIYNEKHPLTSCAFCGQEFNQTAGRKYCSPECYAKAASERSIKRQQKMHPCMWCGKLFAGYAGTKYCSPECSREGRESKKKENTRPTQEGHLQEKLRQAEAQGMSYAELQKRETLGMVGRVVI